MVIFSKAAENLLGLGSEPGTLGKAKIGTIKPAFKEIKI